jgi:hypothetical protein
MENFIRSQLNAHKNIQHEYQLDSSTCTEAVKFVFGEQREIELERNLQTAVEDYMIYCTGKEQDFEKYSWRSIWMLRNVLSSVLEEIKKRRSSRNDCPICFAEMSRDICVLECGHVFHRICQETWQSVSNSCPVCREEVSIKPYLALTGDCVQSILQTTPNQLKTFMSLRKEMIAKFFQ